MNPTEILAQCEAQLAQGGKKAEISLLLRGSFGRGTKRLCPGGPTGRVALERPGGTVLVFFSAQQVKDFLLTLPKREGPS
jgi:hypothetical protein